MIHHTADDKVIIDALEVINLEASSFSEYNPMTNDAFILIAVIARSLNKLLFSNCKCPNNGGADCDWCIEYANLKDQVQGNP